MVAAAAAAKGHDGPRPKIGGPIFVKGCQMQGTPALAKMQMETMHHMKSARGRFLLLVGLCAPPGTVLDSTCPRPRVGIGGHLQQPHRSTWINQLAHSGTVLAALHCYCARFHCRDHRSTFNFDPLVGMHRPLFHWGATRPRPGHTIKAPCVPNKRCNLGIDRS